MQRAVVEGARAGATGLLVTDWGDLGHRQQWPISLAGLARGAEAAWRGTLEHFNTAAATSQLFETADGDVMSWLNQFGDVDRELRGRNRLRNASALFVDFERGENMPRIEASKEDCEQVMNRLIEVRAKLPGMADRQVQDELGHSCDVSEIACEHAIVIREGESAGTRNRLGALADRMRDILDEHRRLWRMRCREGGLARSCSHYLKIESRLRAASMGACAI
jgi:hypothetical protein